MIRLERNIKVIESIFLWIFISTGMLPNIQKAISNEWWFGLGILFLMLIPLVIYSIAAFYSWKFKRVGRVIVCLYCIAFHGFLFYWTASSAIISGGFSWIFEGLWHDIPLKIYGAFLTPLLIVFELYVFARFGFAKNDFENLIRKREIQEKSMLQ